MMTTAALESIANLLPGLPDESVEEQLVIFDSLVRVSDQEQRSIAAELLRGAAASSQDSARRERLSNAAEAVATGQPCALTPNGLTAAQAAASQTVTADEWREPVFAADMAAGEDEDDTDDSEYMDEEPPKLPHLPVRHFFPGLIVRVASDFTDAQGRTLCSGELLTLLACERLEGGGYLLNLLVRTVRLEGPDYAAMVENAGNAWFQPVPTIDSLRELCEAIDLAMSDEEEDRDLDDDDEIERLETLSGEIEACDFWLTWSSKSHPAPECRSAPLAAKMFGRDHHLTFWIRLLFAGVAAVPREPQDSKN